MAKNYISLKEATKYCSYSQDYLKLRARQGKLKAIKIGKNWFTTPEWVKEYLNEFSSPPLVRKRKKKEFQPSWHFNLNFKKYLPPLFIILIIIFAFFGLLLINFKLLSPIVERIIPTKVIEIEIKN